MQKHSIGNRNKDKDKSQKNTQIQPTDCRGHEFRLAMTGVDDKTGIVSYVFYCVHCLYRTIVTDLIKTQTEGEKTNG